MISLKQKQIENRDKWIKHFSDNYGFEYFPPNFEKVPFASQFFEESAIKEGVYNVEQYLLLTCPINTGFVPYHSESRILRRDIFTKEEFTNYEKYNKLAINRWGSAPGKLLFVKYLGYINKDYLNLKFFNPNVYGGKPFDEKRKMIECFDTRLYRILENLYNDYGKTQ